jgi:hypothetical protein
MQNQFGNLIYAGLNAAVAKGVAYCAEAERAQCRSAFEADHRKDEMVEWSTQSSHADDR